MLWRASQLFGHFHHAVLQIAGRGHILSPLLHTTLRVRCMSAALALQARAIFITPTPQSIHFSSRKNGITSKPISKRQVERESTRPRTNTFRSLPQPRPDLVKMVDALFTRRRSGNWEPSDLKTHWKNSEALSHLEDHVKARKLAVLMVNTGLPYRACHVLLLAHAFGCTFKQSVYEGIAYQMAQTGQWAELPALVALGRRQTGQTTVRLLNWRARAAAEVSHFGLLNRVLEQFEEEGIPPNRRTYHVLVSGHLRNRDLVRAKECLGWMEEAGFPMDASTHAILVSNYRSLGSDSVIRKQALGSLQELGEKNATAVINSLIQVSLDTRDIRSALKYLSFFDNPSPGIANAPRAGDHSLAADSERRAFSGHPGPDTSKPNAVLCPDIATFTMLINYAAQMRDFSLASQMLERLKYFAVQPDDIFVAAVIRFYCAVGDITTALSIASTACQNAPSALSYLRALGLREDDTGRPDLMPPGLGLSTRIVNALLEGVLTHRSLDGMRDILSLLRKTDLEPDERTVEILMSHVSTTGPRRPRELIRVLRLLPDRLQPTLRHVNILLQALVGEQIAAGNPPGWGTLVNISDEENTEDTSELRTPFSMAPSDSTQILEEVAKSVIRRRPSYRSVVHRLVMSLTSRHVLVDRATMHLAIRHEALVNRNMEMARQMLSVMLERGMHANEYHYAAIIEGYSLSGYVHTAEKVLWRARDAGFARDPVLFTILIHAYGRIRRPHEATRVFQAMVKEGIEPDVGSVNALAGAYHTVRSFATAKRVFVESWQKFAPFPVELENANLRTLATAFRKLSPYPLIPLSGHRSRHLRFRLKQIVQRHQRRRFAVAQKRMRKRVRIRAERSLRNVSDRTSANKHTIIQ